MMLCATAGMRRMIVYSPQNGCVNVVSRVSKQPNFDLTTRFFALSTNYSIADKQFRSSRRQKMSAKTAKIARVV
jgi:hypothetical protein